MKKILVFILVAVMALSCAVPAMAADVAVVDEAVVELAPEAVLPEALPEEAPAEEAPAAEIEEVVAEDVAATTGAVAVIVGAENAVAAPAPLLLSVTIDGKKATEADGYSFKWLIELPDASWKEFMYFDGTLETSETLNIKTTSLEHNLARLKCEVTKGADVVTSEPVELQVKFENTIVIANGAPIFPGESNPDGTIALNAEGTKLTLTNANITLENYREAMAALFVHPIGDFEIIVSGENHLSSSFPSSIAPETVTGIGLEIIMEEGKNLFISGEDKEDIPSILNCTGGYIGLGTEGGNRISIMHGLLIDAKTTGEKELPGATAFRSSAKTVDIVTGLLSATSNSETTASFTNNLTLGEYGLLNVLNNGNSNKSTMDAALFVGGELNIYGGHVKANMLNATNPAQAVEIKGNLRLVDAGELAAFVKSDNSSVVGVSAKKTVNDSGTIRATAKTKDGALAVGLKTGSLLAKEHAYILANAESAKAAFGIYACLDESIEKGTIVVSDSTVRGVANSKGDNVGIKTDMLRVNNNTNDGYEYGKLIGETKNGIGIEVVKQHSSSKAENYKKNYKPTVFKIAVENKIITPSTGEISTHSHKNGSAYEVCEIIYHQSGGKMVPSKKVVIG